MSNMAFQPNYPAGCSANPELHHSAPFSSITPNIPALNPWLQIPPSVMPWTIENRPHLVRFGESSRETENWGNPSQKIKYHKRKSDLDFNITPPVKVHITEEKMAAQLRNMHISNNEVDEQGLGNVLDEGSNRILPTLILSKEVQNLPSYNEPFLPEALVPKNNKPTRALVLWRPPAGSLTSDLISSLQTDQEEKEDNTNNNSTTPDLNSMAASEFAGSTTEMELS